MKKTNTTTSIPVIVEPIDADGYVRPYVRTKVSDAEHAHSIAMRLLRKDSRLAAVGIFHAEFDSTLAYLYRSDFNAAVAQELQLQDRRPATGLRTESTPGMAAGIEKATNIFALLQERGGPGKPLPWWHPECLSAREARRSDLEQQLQDNLDDARRERAERGVRGLARLFSAGERGVWRAKMQLLLHGFPIPKRAKPLTRPPLTLGTAIRLIDELRRRHNRRQVAALCREVCSSDEPTSRP